MPLALPHKCTKFQSTPPVKAATRPKLYDDYRRPISIHAAREGGDIRTTNIKGKEYAISIHAAREGGDCKGIRLYLQPFHFNPRRP